jgi:hypothetical protein
MERQQHGWPLPTGDLKPALELALAVTHGDMGVLMLHDEAQGGLRPVLGVGLNSDHIAAIGTQRRRTLRSRPVHASPRHRARRVARSRAP